MAVADVGLHGQFVGANEVLTIRKSKTNAGVRTIPMNQRALEEMRRIQQPASAIDSALG